MGFNAARLEWNVAGLEASPKSVTTDNCDIATAADIESSMLPPSSVGTPQPTGNPTLPQDPPAINDGICSSDLPTTSTTDRFVYMADYLCSQVRCSVYSSGIWICNIDCVCLASSSVPHVKLSICYFVRIGPG